MVSTLQRGPISQYNISTLSFSSSSKMIVIVDHNIMLGIILLMQVERF